MNWPSARADHAAEYIVGNRQRQKGPVVVVTGGIDDTGNVLEELWLFFVDDGTWSKVRHIYSMLHWNQITVIKSSLHH